jgi:ketosteroid isomerase-like protein
MPFYKPQEIHTLFVDAFNRADVEALVALYEPTAILASGSGNAVGHAAIRVAYQNILAGGGRMELETLAVLESGEGLAVLHAGWTLHRDGQSRAGLSTEVVRRQSDGTWLFVLDEPRTSGCE